MRTTSWFRGPLLIGLFVALLIGALLAPLAPLGADNKPGQATSKMPGCGECVTLTFSSWFEIECSGGGETPCDTGRDLKCFWSTQT